MKRRKPSLQKLSFQALMKLARKDEMPRLDVLEELVARSRADRREVERMKEHLSVARWAGFHEACEAMLKRIEFMGEETAWPYQALVGTIQSLQAARQEET